ncbi:hypothetical protein ES703_122203 [subsurface metagenome]
MEQGVVPVRTTLLTGVIDNCYELLLVAHLRPIVFCVMMLNMRKEKQPRVDYQGTSKKSKYSFRASKYNPYICDHCGYRTTRYSNMVRHLENVHNDPTTDPRAKSIAVKQGIVAKLREWQAL